MILVHIPVEREARHRDLVPPRLLGGAGRRLRQAQAQHARSSTPTTDTRKTLQRQGETDLKDVDEKAKVAGRKNLIATIEKLIGKPGMIDRYAEVNLASFYEITKAIGGVRCA